MLYKERGRKKMPPEAFLSHPLVTSLTQFIPPLSPKSQLNLPLTHKYCRGKKRMQVTKKKLIPVLVFILSCISILRLLKITISTPSSSPPLPALPSTLLHTCSPPSPACNNTPSDVQGKATSRHRSSANATTLTEKELQLLSNLLSHRAPCNLLVFGLEPQYPILTSINAGGTTIFLEDDPEKLGTVKINSNSTRIYKVEYQIPAKEAYKLLKHARQNPACAPHSRPLELSTCKLALTKLPQEVYELKWDIVVVDGPTGDRAEAPGRMAAIYTASMIARAGNMTNVVVHDVDRMIEKWFSWEFLCEENLVSSKGRLWNFKIKGQLNSTRFCPSKPVQIV